MEGYGYCTDYLYCTYELHYDSRFWAPGGSPEDTERRRGKYHFVRGGSTQVSQCAVAPPEAVKSWHAWQPAASDH